MPSLWAVPVGVSCHYQSPLALLQEVLERDTRPLEQVSPSEVPQPGKKDAQSAHFSSAGPWRSGHLPTVQGPQRMQYIIWGRGGGWERTWSQRRKVKAGNLHLVPVTSEFMVYPPGLFNPFLLCCCQHGLYPNLGQWRPPAECMHC